MSMSKKQDIFLKWAIAPAITVVIIGSGFIAQWATARAILSEVTKDQVKLEQKLSDAQKQIYTIELKTVSDASLVQKSQSDIQEIKNDIREIKNDIKRILGRLK